MMHIIGAYICTKACTVCLCVYGVVHNLLGTLLEKCASLTVAHVPIVMLHRNRLSG
jgi:hypothetical protein